MHKIMFKIIALNIVIIFSSLLAQDNFELMYNNYKMHNYAQIQNQLKKISKEKQNSLEFAFFSALFNTNGEEAKKTFQLIFDDGNPRLKKMAAKKLMDYYYAKGYYVNASKYQEFLIDEQNEQSPSGESIVDRFCYNQQLNLKSQKRKISRQNISFK